MHELERRYLGQRGAEVRMDQPQDGQPQYLAGYAAVFYREGDPATEFELIPGRIVERFLPGCFDQTLRDDDIRCLFNHEPSLILGRNKSGTLQLSTDSRGLFYRCKLPETTTGRDVRESVTRQDVDGSSVGMLVRERRLIEQKDGPIIREIMRAQLYDTGPVTYAAYKGASVALRSADRLEDEIRRELIEPARRSARRRRWRALRTRRLMG